MKFSSFTRLQILTGTLCLLTLCLLTLASSPTFARQRSFIPTAGFGWTAGGDQIDLTPREDISTGIISINEDITAGGEFHIWFGTIWVYNPSLETLITAGYHNDAHSFRGGSANFGRIVYDVIPSYRYGSFRFGAGFSYQVNITYSLTDTTLLTSQQESKFKDVFGQTLSLGYDFSKRGRIDLRYQFIEHTVLNSNVLPQAEKFDGNNIGLHIYVTF